MGSLNPDAESKQELDDSGYVQDETATKQTADEYKGSAQLLDLSDDVLLYILRNCSPMDLKALGFTCPRLAALVLDRTLWVDVDTRGTPHGQYRVRWLLSQALGPHTRRLRLNGYARQADGCLGFLDRDDVVEANGEVGASGSTASGSTASGTTASGSTASGTTASGSMPPEEDGILCRGPCVYKLSQALPRYGGGFPYWPYPGPVPGSIASATPTGCPGPQLTLTHNSLRDLTALCCGLRTLELEDCVIDCNTTNIGMFPKTLTKLSLRGTKCFNLESKSFLFKIQDHLTHLEELDVSYCSWIEPACMLPLSKMPCLRTLAMRECHKLAEFVAYASLATRYGFKKLKILDLRGSPVGDSEVSALGWLPSLEELYLSPSPVQPRVKEHAHYPQDLLPTHDELDDWEKTESEYLKEPPIILEDAWAEDEAETCCNSNNTEAGPACILMERILTEPSAAGEFAHALQLLEGHPNVPLVNLQECREAYQHYMARLNQGLPPMRAGYSLLVRGVGVRAPPRPHERDGQAGPSHAKPGTSTHDEPEQSKSTGSVSKEQQTDEVEPGTSEPPILPKSPTLQAVPRPAGPSNEDGQRPEHRPARKRDLDDSSEQDCPPQKRAGNVEPESPKSPRPSGVLRLPGPSHAVRQRLDDRPAKKRDSDDSSEEDGPPRKRAGDVEPRSLKSSRPSEGSRPPGPSDAEGQRPGDRPARKHDSDDSSEDDGPPQKRACTEPATAKKDSTAAETSSKRTDDERDIRSRQRRRFYEIMIHQVLPRRRERDDEANNEANNEAADNAANDAANNNAVNDAPERPPRIQCLGRYHPFIEEYIDMSTAPLGLIGARLPRGMLIARGPVALLGPTRLDHSSLVTDSSIRRFGRAVGENINYIHIGGGDGRDGNARPDRSSLRVLSVAGFRRVTDVSLQHLATAAPRLRRLDVSDTAVTSRAVERFQAMRPDVDVIASDVTDPPAPAV